MAESAQKQSEEGFLEGIIEGTFFSMIKVPSMPPKAALTAKYL
jgi:hypothetical protein